MNRVGIFYTLCWLLPFALLTACSDVNPVDTLDDSIDEDMEYAENHFQENQRSNVSSSSAYMSESEKCYYGTSIYSDSWCCSNYGYRCSYVSSSSYRSSSSNATYYLTSAKTMKLTLTYYKQVSSDWDAFDGDGDPEVSFTIYTYSDGVSAQTLTSTKFIDLTDSRSWSSSVSKTFTINKGADQIKVCPKVNDEDPFGDDDYSSGKCVTVSNIGYLTSSDIQEQEDYNSKYRLEWEWYLY